MRNSFTHTSQVFLPKFSFFCVVSILDDLSEMILDYVTSMKENKAILRLIVYNPSITLQLGKMERGQV